MRLEDGLIGGGRGVESNLGARLLALLPDLLIALPGYDEDPGRGLDLRRISATLLRTLGDGGFYGPADVLGGVEGVDVEAVAQLAG